MAKIFPLPVLFIFLFDLSLATAGDSFESWKASFIKKSAKEGLPQDFLKRQLSDVSYDKSIIEMDRNQLTSDTTIDYEVWIEKWMGLNSSRIRKGKELLRKHKKILSEIENRYQVDKEAIVALWGVETLYGNIMGSHDIISVLTTLAYDKRRRAFFEAELLAALKILHEGHISRGKFIGSWAGAMGQCQFMPTSFSRYAVDYDGDGRKDIWSNKGDTFASIANYLKNAGWQINKSIGMLAKKTRDVKFNYSRMRYPNQYNKLGLRKMDGSKIDGNWIRRIAVIPHKNSPLILRGSNYKVLLKWNRSSLFAALNIILFKALASVD